VIQVVLPVLDEAEALPSVLAGLPPGFDPIVVDNGSTDGSARIARTHGAHVVTEPVRGFGAACFTGLRAATADVVCFMDCDGSFRGHDLVRVASPVADGDADLVLGSRDPTSRRAWPWHARVANRIVAAEVRRRTGLSLRDLGPMRAARRVPLLELGIADRRFGWPLEMVLRAAAASWRVRDVPVAYEPRVGRSKVTGTVVGTVRTALDMTRALR
jgi:dTDP-L-rhamnose 4-epimerase